jgi:hypothetical protein
MPDWDLWIQAERAGKLTPKQQAMLDRARQTGEVPTPGQPQAPVPGTSPTPRSVTDPMSGMPLATTPEGTHQLYGEMAAGAMPAVKFGLAQALGIGLPVAGAALGAASPVPGGTLLGETAGSFAARRANVALGLEEPGMGGDVASLAFPAAGRAAGALVKGVARRLPGVGTAMQDIGMEQARALPTSLTPNVTSDVLYAAVAKENMPVKLPEVASEVGKLLGKEGILPRALQSPLIRDTAEALGTMADEGTDFQTLWLAQKRVRDALWSAKGEERHALAQLDGAIWRDIERMAAEEGTPLASLLRAANKTYRKERAVDDLRDIIEGSITESVQGQGTGRLNAGAMLRKFDQKVRHDDLFAGAFSAEEQAQIRGLLKDLSTIPVIGPVAGAMFGSGMGVGLGGTTFAASGGDPLMTGLAASMPWLLSMALASAPGRGLVKGLMRADRLLTPTGAAALRGFLQTSGQLAAP